MKYIVKNHSERILLARLCIFKIQNAGTSIVYFSRSE
jgi:hypothetical protein